MSRRLVRFYFDFNSNNAYLSWWWLVRAARRDDLSILVRPVPVHLGALLKSAGNQSPADVPNKYAWNMSSCRRKAMLLGLPFHPPPVHPFRAVDALRVCTVASLSSAQQSRLVSRFFDTAWGEGKDLSDAAVMRDAITSCGITGTDIDRLLERANSPETRNQLNANTSAAVTEGAFGVPTMCVDRQLFFGFDELRYLEMYLLGQDPLYKPVREPKSFLD